MSYASDHPVRCAEKKNGCPASHPGSRFDNSKADKAGWFHGKDGTAYCPDHLPDWVGPWRERQAKNKFEVEGTYSAEPAVLACSGCGLREKAGDGEKDTLKKLRSAAFTHGRETGHTVTVSGVQTLTVQTA